uniref:Diadenylate cyclase n=1 Tax=Cyanothece sp. (strain PCC 7425 / ATCC 29141) TaxID=395961 RepID=B8HLE1_CYAP4
MKGLPQGLINPNWTQSWLAFEGAIGLLPPFLRPGLTYLLPLLDVTLVLALTYMVLLVIAERRTLWMVRGFIFLMLATAASRYIGLQLLNFVLSNLVIGSAVAMAVILQSEVRRFLEQLGRGNLFRLLRPTPILTRNADNIVDEIVEAVKELSQNRTGGLILIETSNTPIDERDFNTPGVKLNAELSKELIQTIFQTTTPLHDGAVLIRGSCIVAAGVILPLSDRTASRQLGTRHRAAMGITERVQACACIVVSEETGSISLAEKGILNRPLTSSKLKELLEAYLTEGENGEVASPGFRSVSRQITERILAAIARLLPFRDFRQKHDR